MSDIVEILRRWAEILDIPSGPFVNADLRYAADTITRLRAEVAMWKEAAAVVPSLRAALGEDRCP